MIDPICGMEVSRITPREARLQRAAHYFCSHHCLAKFKEDPEKFLKSRRAAMRTNMRLRTVID